MITEHRYTSGEVARALSKVIYLRVSRSLADEILVALIRELDRMRSTK